MTIIPFPRLAFRFISKEDSSALRSFSCTMPVSPNRQVDGRWIKGESLHPYPWELLVQKLVRNKRSAQLFHDFGFELVAHLPPDARDNSFDIWALK